MKEIKEYLETYQKLLPVGTSISYTEAERRSGEFLSALAMIADVKHTLTTNKIEYTSMQSAVYAQEMAKGVAKTVTENKMNAEASDSYIKCREALENVENDLSFLKAYQEIFTNAHIFYRNMAKGDNS